MLGFLLMQVTTENGRLNFDNIMSWVLDHILDLGIKIIYSAIAYFVGGWIISFIRKFIKRLLIRKKIDGAVASFINSLTNMLLKILLVLFIVSILGIPTISFAAIIAAGSLAVGMAMKDNLSNFAGGVMILLNKPFHLGNTIVAQNQTGVVTEIGILYTVLLTADNKTVYMPNGPLSTGSIVNLSVEENRRIDLVFNISYGNNADNLIEIIQGIIAENTDILKDPEPFVGVTAVYNGNFDLTVRAWGLNADNTKINVALNEAIYRTLRERGIFVSSVLSVRMTQN